MAASPAGARAGCMHSIDEELHMRWAYITLLIGLLALPAGTYGQTPDSGDQSRERRRGEWRNRGPRDGGFNQNNGERGQRGPWGGGPFGGNFTPEQREAFYNRQIERYVERLSNTYELNDEQRQAFQQRLEAVKQQSLATAEQRRVQREQLREQMREQFRQLRELQESGQTVPREQFRQMFDQMRAADRGTLLDDTYIASELERMLPPEQAARGRERYEQEQAEREQRREQWRQQWEQRRQEWRQNNGAQADGSPQEVAPAPEQAAPGDAPAWGGGRRRGWDRGGEGNRGGREWSRRSDGDGEGSERGRDWGRGRGRQGDRDEPAEDIGPTGSWERYTERFIRRYRLDPSQRATAHSILRDMLAQRRQIEEAKRADYAAASQISDPQKRQEYLDSVNRPIRELFESLRAKLDQIPTSAQRAAVCVRATRPDPTVRPFVMCHQSTKRRQIPDESAKRR